MASRRELFLQVLVLGSIGLVVPAQSSAEELVTVLFFCDDDVLGAGEGGCDHLHWAVASELSDYDLTVASPATTSGSTSEEATASVLGATLANNKRFALWLSRIDAGDLVLHVFDPVMGNISSGTFTGDVAQTEEVAFAVRNLVAAVVYSKDTIVESVPMQSPTTCETEDPPEKPEPRHWVRLTLSYQPVGYIPAKIWSHHIGFEIAVLATRKLEIFTEGAFGIPTSSQVAPETGIDLKISTHPFMVGLGARIEAIAAGPFTLLPATGFRIGITKGKVAGSATYEEIMTSPGLWLGFDMRFRIIESLSFVMGARFENVFRYDEIVWGDSVLVTYSQFRFSACAGLALAL